MTIESERDAETPSGSGSVSGAPQLPEAFGDTFHSRYTTVGGVRLHVVTGGQGPALLLLIGWPQNWYAWRLVMLDLARDHTVVAVDPRGTGLSDKPKDGYDSATQATDMARLMTALGHSRFDMIGLAIGMWTAYALAVDHPGRIDRLVVVDSNVPGISPSPPLIGDRHLSDFLWHMPFNRLLGVNEELVRGREDIFFGYQFTSKAATPNSLPRYAIDYYVDLLREPEALRASFDYFRAIDDIVDQNRERLQHRIAIPVLAVGGETACGASVGAQMRLVADDVTSEVVPGGHFVPEEAPSEFLVATNRFLAPRCILG